MEPSITTQPAAAGGPPGTWLVRIGVRTLALYLLLQNLSALVGLLPSLAGADDWVRNGLKHASAWLGKTVLGIGREIPVGLTGSSDTTADWIRTGAFLMLAALAGLIWSVRDRRAQTDAQVGGWMRLGLRYVLGAAMLAYGFMKIVPPTQFPAPSFWQLTSPFAEASPQGLLWRFMGFSPAYVAFLGGAEVAAGLFLYFRRTTLLGALLTVGIMTNVVMLNFCYDVPVKLYSSHLLLMAATLAWPDRRHVIGFLFSGRGGATRAEEVSLPTGLGGRRLAMIGKVFFLGSALYSSIGAQWKERWTVVDRYGSTPAELRGIWRVEQFVRDGVSVPPLATDPLRWGMLIFGDYRVVVARQVDGHRSAVWYVKRGATAGAYEFQTPGSKATSLPVTITREGPSQMALALVWEGAAVKVVLMRVDENKFTLLSRGFHWVTEVSFNR